MASTPSLSSLTHEHVSIIAEIAKVIRLMPEQPDDFADVRRQTLLHLHRSCLMISKELDIIISTRGARPF